MDDYAAQCLTVIRPVTRCDRNESTRSEVVADLSGLPSPDVVRDKGSV